MVLNEIMYTCKFKYDNFVVRSTEVFFTKYLNVLAQIKVIRGKKGRAQGFLWLKDN